MRKLGVLASLLLFTAALVGPMTVSFGQESNSTDTSPSSDTPSTTSQPIEPAPEKKMTDEERIKAQLEKRRAMLESKVDERVKKMKENSLKKAKSWDELHEERMKKLAESKGTKSMVTQEKKVISEKQMAEKKAKLKQKLADKKLSSEERMEKKKADHKKRVEDAKAKFDKKMADKLAKFNAKVKIKSKTAAEIPSKQPENSSQETTEPTTIAPNQSDTGSNSTNASQTQ